MGWLIGDVPLDPCEQGGADAERSVTFLPGEEVVGSRTHRLEFVLRIRTASDNAISDGRTMSIWTWFSVPPTASTRMP